MKILVLAPFVPWPLNQGGAIRVFNLVTELARNHEVTLACLTDRGNPDWGPLATCCCQVHAVPRLPAFIRDFAGFFFGKEAYNLRRFASPEFHDLLAGLASKETYDLLLVEYTYLWQYAGGVPAEVKLLDAHNLEYAIVRQLGRACGNPLKRMLYRLEEQKLKRGEERAWEEADWCLAVSPAEQCAIAGTVSAPQKVLCLPNGVDPDHFRFRGESGGGGGILLLGGMEYFPNFDAARYFLADILPRIRRMAPTVPVQVVGRNLSLLRDWQGAEQVYFHESVPDVRPWLEGCDLLAVPLRHGAGTRIKILEAMAAGIPVVTTAKGCEGIRVSADEHLLIADLPEQFAAAACRVLGERGDALRLTRNARCLVEERYCWRELVQRMVADVSRQSGE